MGVYFLNCHPAVGPKMKEWFTREVEKTKFLEYDRPLGRLRASAEKDVSSLQRLIEETETHTYIAQAKEEGVGLQLEASYRARLQNAFTEVKKRLDYEAEKGSEEALRAGAHGQLDRQLRHQVHHPPAGKGEHQELPECTEGPCC